MKIPTILSIALALILFISCGKEKSGEALDSTDLTREQQIELGKKQWAEDYYGDENRIPSSEEAIAASKRTIAYSNMRSIITAEKQFFAENARYSTDFDELGVHPKDKIYQYSLRSPSPSQFEIEAAGNIDDDKYRDVVVMDVLGDVEIIEDDLRNWKNTDGLLKPARHVQKARDVEKKLNIGMDRRMKDVPEEY